MSISWWRTIRNNIRLLRPETIAHINQILVSAGHAFDSDVLEKVRGDSFVLETNNYYPTESGCCMTDCRKSFLSA